MGTKESDNGWKLTKGTLLITKDFGEKIFVKDNVCTSPWYAIRDRIKSVKVSEGITELPAGTFYDCSNIKSISLPNTLKTIGPQCFHNCSSILELFIPDGVTKIGDYCFTYMTSLQKLRLPNNKDLQIGRNLFDTIQNPNPIELIVEDTILKDIDERNIGHNARLSLDRKGESKTTKWQLNKGELTIQTLDDSESFVKDNKCSAPWYTYRLGIRKVTIRDGVARLVDGMFFDCTRLEEIDVPSSVTELGKQVFHNCSSLVSLTIPNGVKKIGDFCFTFCRNLQKVNFLSKETPSMGTGLFIRGDCNTITVINTRGWGDTSIFTDEKIGSARISYKAAGLTSNYEWSLENGCLHVHSTGSNSVDLPDMVRDNKPSSPWHKYRNGIHEAKITGRITRIGSGLFYDCYMMRKVSIQSDVRTIGYQAFHNCRSLEKLLLPRTVERIGDYCFTFCFSLRVITTTNRGTLTVGHHPFDGIPEERKVVIRTINVDNLLIDACELNRISIEELE